MFDPEIPGLDYLRRAFEQLCSEGLGPGRPRVKLTAANELLVVAADLTPRPITIERVKITFLTPTALKSGGEILREPRFDALLKRARDRVTGLIGLYQDEAPVTSDHLDFRAMGERASAIRMTAVQIEQVEYERRSGRTGQRHSLGGFIGEAEYEGDLAEFLPYLEAARWTGVGRWTVWGNGLLAVATPEPVAHGGI